VVDDRDLEPRTLRRLGFNQVADVGDVLYDGGNPAPDGLRLDGPLVLG
jgi:hypothetical protein